MRRLRWMLNLLFAGLILSGCARKMQFDVSPVVPAATGNVKVKKDDNNNYMLTVKVLNLAPARNLTPSRETYVVWMESNRARVKNLGQINTSKGFLSKTLKGEMKASAISKPTRVFITAEDRADVNYPGNQVVLTTR
jgi:hypothetical protein